MNPFLFLNYFFHAFLFADVLRGLYICYTSQLETDVAPVPNARVVLEDISNQSKNQGHHSSYDL